MRAWHHTYGLPVVVTNCSNNYGPYHFPEKLIPLMILNALEGKPLPVYGKGENVRDWLYVEDHARALLTIAERGRVGESYNVGGRQREDQPRGRRTICALVDEVAPNGGIGPREQLITFVADRPGHDLRYAIDASKIAQRARLGAAETFESGLAQDGAVVSRERGLVGSHPLRRLSRRAARDCRVILLFGASGQLGQEATHLARRRGIAFRALSRSEADVADRSAVERALGETSPALVVNAAAYTKVDNAESEVEEAVRSNVEGPAILAELCAEPRHPASAYLDRLRVRRHQGRRLRRD